MGKPLKKILIIGGLGYLGGRVAKYFSDNDYFVRITTRKSENDFPRNIPKNTKTILDVGCGSGNLALKLLNAGYDVDGVIPSKYLATAVKEKLNGKGQVFVSKFENVKLKKKYDLIIFSESFQYVNMELALKKINASLMEGGYLLICDFFKLNVNEKSLMGG